LDLSGFSNADELASLGLDRLKSALMALGLKCGGTLEDRAQRLFRIKGLSPEQIDPSLFAKGNSRNNVGDKSVSGNKEVDKNKKIALMEAQVYK